MRHELQTSYRSKTSLEETRKYLSYPPKSIYDKRFITNCDIKLIKMINFNHYNNIYKNKAVINKIIKNKLEIHPYKKFDYNYYINNKCDYNDLNINYLNFSLRLFTAYIKYDLEKMRHYPLSYKINTLIQYIISPIGEKLVFTAKNYIYFKILKVIYIRRIQRWYRKIKH